jgi:UDP-4-amino-4,6-dideoxy-N-acetyl-beta-L-altrosamine transaminase
MEIIPYGRQSIGADDIDAVVQVLRSDFLTQGPTVPAFESAVANYCNAECAVAVNSATSALHIACLALGVSRGDLVWTSPITFVASANCVLYCGADIDFVDIDPLTYNLSINCLRYKLEEAKKVGRLPKVVIPVHMAGQSCDMAEIHNLSKLYGFKIIEDASHGIGSKYKNERVGNCRFSDITVFSFHPVKIITAGEGGMATTNNPLIAKKMRLYRSHGITSVDVDMLTRPTQEIWNYQQIELGFNYRMTDIQAALGLSQLNRLDHFVERRHQIATKYDQLLQNLPLTTPYQCNDIYSSHHLYIVRVNVNLSKQTNKQIYKKMYSQGVLVNLHYIPVYLHPFYERMGFKRGYCPEAEAYYSDALSLPIYPDLSNDQQNRVVTVLSEAISV